MKVGIVGGGIGGLLTGVKVSGLCDVDIFEEHRLVGYPKHCTGLISGKVLNSLGSGAGEFVLNTFNNYTLTHTSIPNKELRLKFRDTISLVDRPNIERYLSDVFQSRGGSLYLSLKAIAIDASNTSLIFEDGTIRKYDLIVVAEGAKAALTKSLGMCSNSTYLVGMQSIIRANNDLDSPHVIFGCDISYEFFGWVVPIDSKQVLVGLADRYVDYPKLNYLIKSYLSRRLGINDLVIKEVFGGLIPTSTPCRQALRNVIGVGDAVSVTKPVSGGGIYSITNQVRVLEESLRRGGTDYASKMYLRGLLNLLTTLKIQHLLRNFVISKFGSLSNFVMKLIESEVNEVTLLDYDKYILNPLDLNNLLKSLMALLK